MNLRRLMLAASCRNGARGRMAGRASAEGEFVRALDETDRLLRIAPHDPGGTGRNDSASRLAQERIARALEGVEPLPAPASAWRPVAGAALATAAAAAIVLTPLVVWRSAAAPAPAADSADRSVRAAHDAPRLSWTLVADFDHPLRAEAAALAADVSRFGRLVAPGLPIGDPEGEGGEGPQ
jgi:hypothetical protein